MLIPPDIQKAEIFNNEGNNIFEKLSEKYYNDKYGTTSAERILTCAGWKIMSKYEDIKDAFIRKAMEDYKGPIESKKDHELF